LLLSSPDPQGFIDRHVTKVRTSHSAAHLVGGVRHEEIKGTSNNVEFFVGSIAGAARR
jgi:hypothetical protein